MKQFTRIALIAIVSLLSSRAALAQVSSLADDARPGLISAGAYVGMEFDVPDHALLVGGDARLKIGNANLEINPRFTYRPFSSGSMQQFDVNVLSNLRLVNQGRLRYYSGLGAAIHRLSLDAPAASATDIGLNLIAGARLPMRTGAAYEPFFQVQYTIMKEPGNSFTAVVGTSFSFR